MNAYEAGLAYELRAARFLHRQGLKIRDMRYRAADGEIDLVAQEGDTVVFVEVKARPSSPMGTGIEAVTADKRRRLRHAARVYINKKKLNDHPCRFDIVEFSRAGINYMQDAF